VPPQKEAIELVLRPVADELDVKHATKDIERELLL